MEEEFDLLVREALAAPLAILPPRDQKIGSSNVTWFESDPGVAVILAFHGTSDDRTLARNAVAAQLSGHGYRQAQFTIDGSEELVKTGHWNDIMAKAKRLVQSGAVQMLKNSAQSIMASVQGDHGTYQCEIAREDPNSRSITQWQCECPWDQFAWQRTRKWKKYEGRVCSHVLAAYWQSHSMPVDEEIDPAITKMNPDDPNAAPPLPGAPEPAVNSPALPDAGGQMQMALDAPQGAPADPSMAGPGPAGPTPPMADQLQMQFPPTGPADPGILPQFAGPPQAPLPPQVSVPGTVGPTPFNPIQNPASPDGMGGTYSKVAVEQDPFIKQPDGFQNGNMVSLNNTDSGIAEGKSEAHGSGQWREVQKGSIGEVMGQDPTTGMVEVIYPLHDSGPMEPYHVRMYHFPSEITLRPDVRRPGPFRKRR